MAEVRNIQIASRMEGITEVEALINAICEELGVEETCLLYTSPSPRD